jgi:hypothetical protein
MRVPSRIGHDRTAEARPALDLQPRIGATGADQFDDGDEAVAFGFEPAGRHGTSLPPGCQCCHASAPVRVLPVPASETLH